MQRIFIFLSSLFVCIFTMSSLAATFFEGKQGGNELRILELLPDLLCPLAVNPGIPENYIALSSDGKLNLCDWIYWGPKDVLEAYFENPESLEVPIFRVKLCADVAQTGPKSFTHEDSLKMFKKEEGKEFTSTKFQWGIYPVLSVRTKIECQFIFMAWVGLNDPESGWTLLFNLVYPDQKGHPNKKDHELWDSLLTKTTQLTVRYCIKAYGQDLQEGYTYVNVGGAKLKMLAEKRQSDGVLQVVVIPEDFDVEFHYMDMMEGLMEGEWKCGEPLVKVYGEIVVNRGNYRSTTGYTTSIFVKTVPEFSFKKEDEKKLLIFQK